MPKISFIMLPVLAALTTACGSGSGDGAGGVSAAEASALNDAAAMLDARSGATGTQDADLNPAAVAAARADRNRVPAHQKEH